jgi:hypothetical protein
MVNCAHAQEKTSPAKSHEKQESDQAATREGRHAYSKGCTEAQDCSH